MAASTTYLTIEQVQEEYPHHVFTDERRPTITEIDDEWIDEAAAVINATLKSVGYSVIEPTDTDDLDLLRRICKSLVVGRISKVMHEQIGDLNANVVGVSREDDAMKMLELIREQKLLLNTAITDTVTLGAYDGYVESSTISTAARVKKDMVMG